MKAEVETFFASLSWRVELKGSRHEISNAEIQCPCWFVTHAYAH